MKVAGIAGGVGTTVLATVLGAEDAGRDVATADVIVARNDYRCGKQLVVEDSKGRVNESATIVLLIEEDRSLTARDFSAILNDKYRVVAVDVSPAIARADDAGLLEVSHSPVRRYVERLAKAGLKKEGVK